MLLTPLSMSLASRLYVRLSLTPKSKKQGTENTADSPLTESDRPMNSVIIAGFGRVGQNVARGLDDAGIPFRVIELDPEVAFGLRCEGKTCLYGDASNAHVLSKVNLAQANLLVVTFPDPLATLTTVKAALEINRKLKVVTRVHRDREAKILRELGVEEMVNPEYEASLEFIRKILSLSGWQKTAIKQTISVVRQDQEIAEFSPDEDA
jgi:CPA2 family monovalent cation:H+ antiporter-2